MVELVGRTVAEGDTLKVVSMCDVTVTDVIEADAEMEVSVNLMSEEVVYVGFAVVRGIPSVVFARTPDANAWYL